MAPCQFGDRSEGVRNWRLPLPAAELLCGSEGREFHDGPHGRYIGNRGSQQEAPAMHPFLFIIGKTRPGGRTTLPGISKRGNTYLRMKQNLRIRLA